MDQIERMFKHNKYYSNINRRTEIEMYTKI